MRLCPAHRDSRRLPLAARAVQIAAHGFSSNQANHECLGPLPAGLAQLRRSHAVKPYWHPADFDGVAVADVLLLVSVNGDGDGGERGRVVVVVNMVIRCLSGS